jgi:ABC-type ATPase involved in cell division
MIRAYHLEKVYADGIRGLPRTSFSLERGKTLLLCGRHGSGKSTLLDILFLLKRPTRGQVFFEGASLVDVPDGGIPLHRRRVALFRPTLPLSSRRTVEENVACALAVAGLPGGEISRRTEETLLPLGLGRVRRFFPPQLPPFDRALVLLAREAAKRPCLFLADDPGVGLDPDDARRFASLFLSVSRGATRIVATNAWQIPGAAVLRLDGEP